MTAFHRYFPLEQILILESEEFVARPWSVLGKIEEFVGVEHELREENFVYNSTKG